MARKRNDYTRQAHLYRNTVTLGRVNFAPRPQRILDRLLSDFDPKMSIQSLKEFQKPDLALYQNMNLYYLHLTFLREAQ